MAQAACKNCRGTGVYGGCQANGPCYDCGGTNARKVDVVGEVFREEAMNEEQIRADERERVAGILDDRLAIELRELRPEHEGLKLGIVKTMANTIFWLRNGAKE